MIRGTLTEAEITLMIAACRSVREKTILSLLAYSGLRNKELIAKRVYPHLFRHSLATNMLIRGAHILAIQEQLGHAFVETTMVYLHAAPIAMQAQYRFFAPSYL